MATFLLSGQLIDQQPQFTFIGPSYPNLDPRSDTAWDILGPTVTGALGAGGAQATLTETYWHIFGTGLGTEETQLPTTGTITALRHATPFEIDPVNGIVATPPATVDQQGIFHTFVFTQVTGLSIDALDFSAAVSNGTIANLLTAGNDEFRGFSTISPWILGTVRLNAGAGNDSVYGGGAGNLILGEAGDDLILLRNDSAPPGPGSTLDGGTGDDVLRAGLLADLLFGGDGSDRLMGDGGDDVLAPGADRDRVMGGAGSDVILVNQGEVEIGEILDGGESAGDDDRLDVAAAGQVLDLSEVAVRGIETLRLVTLGDVRLTRAQLDSLDNIEFGSPGGPQGITLADAGFTDLADVALYTFSAGVGQLVVKGTALRDVINGRDAFDVGPDRAFVTAYGAADIIAGGGGNDVVNGGGGGDTLRGDAGADVLRGEGGDDRLEGGTEADQLVGGSGVDTLLGGAGDDVLDPGSNPNLPFEGAFDLLRGEAGNDTYFVRGFNVTVEELAGGGIDTAVYYFTTVLADQVENMRLVAGSDANVSFGATGNALANAITGNDAANLLDGAVGADRLFGLGGNDELRGGADNDVLFGQAGDDTLIGGAGADIMNGGPGADLFYYDLVGDSTLLVRDRIDGFDRDDDLIMLAGFGPLTFIGGAAFTGLGQVRAAQVPGTTNWQLLANTTGTTAPDFAVLVTNVTGLDASDLSILNI